MSSSNGFDYFFGALVGFALGLAAKHEQPDEVMFDKDRVMLVLRAWLAMSDTLTADG